ncbi:hypothetical protein ACFQ58_01620 [Agromyces sp. NPDC056523]|uniref:hypothetical protein n=1 Tax=Agromyces sp. NPDC056523 TaxID=3345850 RepID=UPI00366D4713
MAGPTASMVRSLVRSWPMLSALGAGLVLIAVAAGALEAAASAAGGPATGPGGVAVGAGLVGCGIAAFGWALLALRSGRSPAPRSVLASALGVLGLSAALVASGATPILEVAALPLLVADVFVIAVAAGAAAELRRMRQRRTLPARTSVIGVLVGAVLVAALATPALAATPAGDLAVPHGDGHGMEHRHP